jgi:hypothetical protein
MGSRIFDASSGEGLVDNGMENDIEFIFIYFTSLVGRCSEILFFFVSKIKFQPF